ncbi:MAG: hypothetical protein AAB539_02370 [Patescibacteria group bacterium]
MATKVQKWGNSLATVRQNMSFTDAALVFLSRKFGATLATFDK